MLVNANELPKSPTQAEHLLANNSQLQLTPNTQRMSIETSFTCINSPSRPPVTNGMKKLGSGILTKAVPASGNAPMTKTKSVAFSSNPSYPPSKYKPTTLSLCETRPNPFDGKIVDLIYDDWFGLAPLASPESLSELSSISSRASIGLNLNLAGSIEKYLNKVSNRSNPLADKGINNIQQATEVFESQLHTPNVMRRTPKFSDNLATCADDWKSVNNYKRMGMVFVTNPQIGSDSDSNGDGSYETVTSLSNKEACCNNNNFINETTANVNNNNYRMQQDGSGWKSADNIDNNDNTNKNNNKFTVSDSAMGDCNSGCPICPCTKLPPEACCLKFDHISCILSLAHQQHYGKYSITNTASSSDTYHSAMSSLTGSDCGFIQNGRLLLSKLGATYEEELLTCEFPSSAQTSSTLNPTSISSITRSGILESHFPVYLDSSDEKSSLLSHENSPRIKNTQAKTVRYSQSCSIKPSRKNANSGDEDYCGFSRNESLPLLSHLAERSSPTSFVKRKKVVYPIHTPPLIQQHNNTITITTQSTSSPASINNLHVFRNESSV